MPNNYEIAKAKMAAERVPNLPPKSWKVGIQTMEGSAVWAYYPRFGTIAHAEAYAKNFSGGKVFESDEEPNHYWMMGQAVRIGGGNA